MLQSKTLIKNKNWRRNTCQVQVYVLIISKKKKKKLASWPNHPNFIFRQFRVFGSGPIPKNENVEFAESFRMDRNWS